MRRSASFFVITALALTVVVHVRAVRLTGHGSASGQLNPAQLLDEAVDNYKEGRYKTSEAMCDRVLLSLQSLPSPDALQSNLLLTAYELRGRVKWVQRKPDSAREDFRALLSKNPSHTFGSATERLVGVVNPESLKAFEEVRKEVVGAIVLSVTPAAADVILDGAVVPQQDREAGQPRLVTVGPHTVLVQRPGFEKREETIAVGPGATVTVDWALVRLTSQVNVFTNPPGVEVLLDGVSKGKTPAGPPPVRSSAAVTSLGSLNEVSGPLLVGDISKGIHKWEFKLDCYVSEQETVDYGKPGDSILPKKLVEASSLLRIEGTGGRVFVDGVLKGNVPYTEKLCPRPQPQRIEIRTERGRQFQNVTPVAGNPITIQANPKPAIALLSQAGLPPSFQIDLRQELETAFAASERVTFFTPNAEAVKKEMTALTLEPGWLSFDTTGRAQSTAAYGMSKERRLTVSTALARNLEVQGIAEINVQEPREPRTVLLTYVAAASGVPETVQIKLDDPRSVRAAVAALNSSYATTRVSSGLEVADVSGVSGAVVLRQVWDLTNGVQLAAGDVIESVDGRKTEDGTAFETAIAARKPGDKVQLQVKTLAGPTKTVTLAPAAFSLVVGFYDETLPVNRLLIDFRNRVLDAVAPHDESIARLNLAVLLMRANNWTDAKAELDKVRLDDLQGTGQAVSKGTVQYYLGLCLEQLDRRAEAMKAFQAAAASPGALLTGDDNTLVKPLAEQKLRPPR